MFRILTSRLKEKEKQCQKYVFQIYTTREWLELNIKSKASETCKKCKDKSRARIKDIRTKTRMDKRVLWCRLSIKEKKVHQETREQEILEIVATVDRKSTLNKTFRS